MNTSSDTTPESSSLDSRTEVKSVLSQVHHDMKNPLSIISGNAEFLLELGRAAGIDESAMGSIRDIEEAAHDLEDIIDELARLREQL